jgi:hypothetical protein
MSPVNGASYSGLTATALPSMPTDNVRQLDLSGVPLYKFTLIPNDPPDAAPDNLYAQVKVGDRVMAKIYNGGTVEMLDDAQAPELAQQGTGPQLAQARADQIAQALNGTIVKADTAQTQDQWVPVRALHHYLADVTVVHNALEALTQLAAPAAPKK